MQGRRDLPLSPRGRAEVGTWRLPADIANAASDDVQWLASPLRRATETAEILHGAAPQDEPALIEMDWGAWEGYTLDELRRRYGAEFARNEATGLDFQPPGGERPRDVRERVVSWFAEIAPRRQSLVAVTHKGVLRAVLAAATGWDMTSKPPIRLRDGALHRFAVDARGRVSVVECNVALAAPGGVNAM